MFSVYLAVMTATDRKPNWVDRRAAADTALTKKAPELWNAVRSAIQDACESYRKHYSSRYVEPVKDTLENGSRIRVDLPTVVRNPARESPVIRLGVSSIIVSFNRELPAVQWADDKGSHHVLVSADEHGAFLLEGETRISPDELSRIILKPFLFPTD